MSTTLDSPERAPSAPPATPPPSEDELAAAGVSDRLAELDPWEGMTEEDRERGYRELTPEEGRFQFDRGVRIMLGISGAEFIRRWDAGEYAAYADRSGYRYLMELGMMSAFARG